MMGKTKAKTFVISFLLAVVAACLSVALVACSGGEKETGNTGIYGVGEEGVYYYDKDADTEYIMQLQSGVYVITEGGIMGYTGTYTCSEDGSAITFTTDDGKETFYATFADDAMSLDIGTAYTFLARRDYTLTFTDGSTVISEQPVRYGRVAEYVDGEADGRVFLGWYADAAHTVPYNFDTAVTADGTVYAWYVDIDYSAINYAVTFVGTDGEVLGTAETVNGRVYEFPEYDGILGWWVSATNDAATLTYRYDAESNPENYPVLTENTNLYAVANATGVLGGSVYGDRVTWMANASSVTIAVDGETLTTTAAGGSFPVDIDGLSTGAHEITLSAQGYGDETLVYVVNALDRVSKVEFYDNFIVYAAVENAQYYYVTVECAKDGHETEYVYNGSSLYYDFTNCEMGPEGIKFTIYACAPGYVTSVSEVFVYALILDSVAVTIDSSTDTATWTAVSGATGYEVYVNGAYVATVSGCEYSLKNYGKGDITVAVKPVAPRYYSEISDEAAYTKITLKAPEITSVSEYEISWDDVEGAVSYELNINGYLIDVGDATTYLLTETDLEHVSDEYTNVLSVTAVAAAASENSQQSDLVYVTDKTMSPALTYSDGTVYWQYALSAKTYYVEYGDTRTPVEGANSFDITFTHSGDNVIKVFIVDEDNERKYAELTVYAYAIIFDVREKADGVDTIYVAKGDTITLTEPTNVEQYYTFGGWYTLPDVVEDPWAESYTAGGVLYADDALFDGNSTLILYAFYTKDKSEITLTPDGGTVTDEDGNTVTSVKVPLGISDYTLEVPVADNPEDIFYGWYSQANGKGTKYTDQYGNGLVEFTNEAGTTLYAYWIKALKFSPTTYQGETLLKVEKGADIGNTDEVTIPATATYEGKEYEVGVINADAFYNCDSLVTINIPDTMRYVAVTNNGYTSGNGAFALANNIVNVNVIPSEGNFERHYYSVDGVLFRLDDLTGTAELLYYPYGRTDASYTITSEVYNVFEYADVAETKNVVWDVGIIGTRVFYNHSELTSITIPSSVTTIYSEAFYSCSGLTSVVFESDEGAPALTIGEKAFRSCTALTEITLPARLKSFDSSIFTSCKNIANIYVSGSNGNYSSIDGLLCDSTGTQIVYCPVGRAGDIEIGVSGKTLANITSVGESAFDSCTLITGVTIGERVTSIGDYAFSGCTGMASLTFESGDANSSKLSIGYQAFYGCTNSAFTSVTLPSRLNALAECAFGNCSKLTTVTYDSWLNATAEELSGLKPYAFCTTPNSSGVRTSYVTTINLGANVPVIDFAAIFGGSKLTTVTIDSGNENYSVSEDGVLVFDKEQTKVLYCIATASGTITLPNTVESIADNAFQNCTGVTQIVLNAGIKTIGVQAFYGCTALVEINFPEGLTTIGDEAFYNCTSLLSVSLPASLEWMGAYDSNGTLTSMDVFEGCSSLQSITVAEGNQNFITKDGVLYLANIETVTETDEYEQETTTQKLVATELLVCPLDNGVSEIEIPSTVTNIVANAFKDNTGVVKVSFENDMIYGTLTIGDSAFQSAKSLETIELPKGLTTIGDKMFYQCSSLKNITIPYTVTSVGAQAFYQCYALEYVYFEHADASLGEEEVSLTFGTGTTATTGGTFAYTTNLIYTNIPDRTTQMCGYMFYNSGIQNVVIGGGVETLPRCTFAYTTNLQNIQFGEFEDSEVNLKYFESNSTNSVFANANGNFELILPEGFLEFGGYDFYYCDGVTKVFIPKTTQQLGNQIFFYAHNVEEIIFEEGIGTDEYMEGAKSSGKGIDFTYTQMFSNCTSLKRIDVPASVTTFSGSTFGSCESLEEVNFRTDENGYSSLKEMQRYEFSGTALTSFTFPNTDPDREDGGKIAITDSQNGCIFRWCDKLTEVTLSNGIQEHIDYVLGEAVHLTTVNIGTCWAYALEDNILYSTVSGEIATTVGEVAGDITIPYYITKIGAFAFQNASSLTSIALPVTMESVGTYAFDGCNNLKAVTFYTPSESDMDQRYAYSGPSESMTFSKDCFRNCTALTSIEFPENAVQFGTSLSADGYTFRNCTALEKVVLSSQTVRLAAYMFSGCSNLKVVTFTGDVSYNASADYSETGYMNLPSTIRFMGNYCFQNSGMITAYIPATTTGTSTSSSATSGFGTYMFNGCENLKTVIFEAGADTLNTYCFNGCTSLVSIVIPAGIIELPNYCFRNCSSLTSVTFESGSALTTVGTYVFAGCTALTSVDLPTTVTSLGNYAFNEAGITSINLSSNVTSLGTNMFQDCTSLVSASIADVAITSLPNYTFDGCVALTTVALPSDMTTFGTYVFRNCSSLTEIDVSGITTFGNYSFYGCTSLTEMVLSDSTTTLGTYMFYGCTSLEYVELNGTYTQLQNYIFNGCTALKSIDIPDRVTYLGTYAFQGCTSLEEVVLPKALNGLGTGNTSYSVTGSAYTFDGCTSLRKVVLNDSIVAISGYVFRNCESLKIVTYASDPDYSAYNDDYYMENGYFAIPSSMVTIGTYSFSGSGIVTLTLPKLTATSGTANGIGTRAFENCTSLVSVTFNSDSTRMGEYMFNGCTSLVSVTIPASISYLGSYQFCGCTSLEEVSFLGNNTELNVGAFQGCTSLKEITLPRSLETIDEYAFDGCTALETVEAYNSLTLIEAYAFRDCKALEAIDLPEFLETIEDYAFVGSGLTTIEIPEFVTYIGIAAFGGCDGLATMTVDASNPCYSVVEGSMLVDAGGKLVCVLASVTGEVSISGGTITEIGEDAFYGTSGITKITLEGVKVVGDYAFAGQTALTEISLGGVESIGAYAFQGTQIATIEIPTAITGIGDYAFYGIGTLASVTYASGNELVAIGEYAFADTGLTAISIPDTVTSIGAHAFDGTAVTALTLGTQIESVGEYAFANIETLTSVGINCSAEFGEGTFSGDTQLATVTFATGIALDGITDRMFEGCTVLTSISLPAGMTYVGAYAFAETGLTSVALPDTVETIGDCAFYMCESLETATLSAALRAVGDYAFAESGLTGIVLPASVETIGNYAFANCSSMTSADLSAAATISIGDYAFANDTGISTISVSYEHTVSIGEGAFSGWTSSQIITIDATYYYATHKWMWNEKTTANEAALETWLYGCDATFNYTGMPETGTDESEPTENP